MIVRHYVATFLLIMHLFFGIIVEKVKVKIKNQWWDVIRACADIQTV